MIALLLACVATSPGAKDSPIPPAEQTWCTDADGDGFGDPASCVQAATAPTGSVGDATDCDDAAEDIFPGAPEHCDGIDEDCDAVVDNDAIDPATWYEDADSDGFGATPVVACEMPVGAVAVDGDCDDASAGIFPGAPEHCDGIDEDCDGVADNDAINPTTWYEDVDSDGFGATAVVACEMPVGAVALDGDCDDASAGIFPGAPEHCDGIDEDCDGVADNDAIDPTTWYEDADSDGFGTTAVVACEMPDGTVAVDGDCDDTSAGAFPGAPEHCDGTDEDCDGVPDNDAIDPTTGYEDADSDGFGATAVVACEMPVGAVAVDGDCDDASAGVFPSAPEHCDGVDEDCDGVLDNDAIDPTTWYEDADSDGFGATAVVACEMPDGAVEVDGDCDDTSAGTFPDAPEYCDGIDEDCDGVVDNDAIDPTTWYEDADGDGFGATAVVACEMPDGAVAIGGDCDDASDDIFPDAPEHCDGVDEDCDGVVDDDVVEPFPVYADGDGDGFGSDDGALLDCAVAAGFSDIGGDCDDEDAQVSPDATETCADGIDSDCDGSDPERCGPDGATTLGTTETRIIGNTSTMWTGMLLGNAGDFNGDGRGDVMTWIGDTPSFDLITPERGTSVAVSTAWGRIDTEAFLSGSGFALGGGDLDGDGVDDLVVPSYDADDTIPVLVYLGPHEGALARADADGWVEPSDVWGWSVTNAAWMGDVNADGTGDLALVDYWGGLSEYAGEIWVVEGPFEGGLTLTDTPARIHPHPDDEFIFFGFSLCATDLDGDGVTDLVGGAPSGEKWRLDPAYVNGSVFAASGPFAEDRTLDDGAGGLADGDAFWGWAPGDGYTQAGHELSCGDVDGDGLPEVLVSGMSLDDRAGIAWLLPGSATGVHTFDDATWSVVGTAADEAVGESVTLESDMDADGRAEVIVGSDGVAFAGRVGLFYGTTLTGATTLDSADASWTGATDEDAAVYAESAGDLDADGFDDLLIGVPGLDEGGPEAGGIYVIYGGGL